MVVAVATGEGVVPAPLPLILKDYTKAAIRTQPRDLLRWSHAYFRALSAGEVPPVKDRLEFPVPESTCGITPGILRILHKQLNDKSVLNMEELQQKCLALDLDEEVVKEAWNSAVESEDSSEASWDNILSYLAKAANPTVVLALQSIMAVITEDPVTQKVNASTLMDHYQRILPSDDHYEQANDYLNDIAEFQSGFLVPSDLTRPSCPPLE